MNTKEDGVQQEDELRLKFLNILELGEEPSEFLVGQLRAFLEFVNQYRVLIFSCKTEYIISIFHILNLLNQRESIPESILQILPMIKRNNNNLLKIFFNGQLNNYSKEYQLFCLDFMMLAYIDLYDGIEGIQFSQQNLVKIYEIFSGLEMSDILVEFPEFQKYSPKSGSEVYSEILMAPYRKIHMNELDDTHI